MRELEVTLTFKVGTLKEIGMGGFHQGWLSGELDGVNCDLTSGAGLGNPFLNAMVKVDGRTLHAQADISELAATLWDEMRKELKGERDEPAADHQL